MTTQVVLLHVKLITGHDSNSGLDWAKACLCFCMQIKEENLCQEINFKGWCLPS